MRKTTKTLGERVLLYKGKKLMEMEPQKSNRIMQSSPPKKIQKAKPLDNSIRTERGIRAEQTLKGSSVCDGNLCLASGLHWTPLSELSLQGNGLSQGLLC